MPRERLGQSDDAEIDSWLPNLTGTVSYRVLEVVKDGRKSGVPSAFVVQAEMREQARGTRKDARIFMKVFPYDAKNTVRFKADRAANARLNAYSEGPMAGRTIWPKCFGRLRLENDIVFEGMKFSGRRALLFEHIGGLRLLEKDQLDERICTEVIASVKVLHNAGVVHRDFYEFNAAPDVAFRNIYLKDALQDGGKADIVILDFDHAKVLPPPRQVVDEEEMRHMSNREKKRLERIAQYEEAELASADEEVEGLRELFRRVGAPIGGRS